MFIIIQRISALNGLFAFALKADLLKEVIHLVEVYGRLWGTLMLKDVMTSTPTLLSGFRWIL